MTMLSEFCRFGGECRAVANRRWKTSPPGVSGHPPDARLTQQAKRTDRCHERRPSRPARLRTVRFGPTHARHRAGRHARASPERRRLVVRRRARPAAPATGERAPAALVTTPVPATTWTISPTPGRAARPLLAPATHPRAHPKRPPGRLRRPPRPCADGARRTTAAADEAPRRARQRRPARPTIASTRPTSRSRCRTARSCSRAASPRARTSTVPRISPPTSPASDDVENRLRVRRPESDPSAAPGRSAGRREAGCRRLRPPLTD